MDKRRPTAPLFSTAPNVWFAKNSQEGCTLTSPLVNDWFSTTSISAMAYVSYWYCPFTLFYPLYFRFLPFGDKVRTFTFPPSVFPCSYDICSLFTNVTLGETIEIYDDALYNGELTSHSFPRAIFVELMQTATSSVEFGFNNIIHGQIDGVAMDSSLGPSHANIFVGYYEALLFKKVNKPLIH